MAEINTSMDQSLLGSQRADTLDLENGAKLAWHAVYTGKLLSTKQELLVTLGPQGDLCLDLESGTQDCWPKRCLLPSKIAGSDVIGARVKGSDVTVYYCPLVHPTGQGSHDHHRTTRRSKQLKLGLQDAEEAAALAASIRGACSPAAPRRMLVLVNPVSGRGKGRSLHASKVAPLLEAAGVSPRLVVTSGPGDATRTVSELDPVTVDAIAIVGGDGTVHEVLQGLLARRDWQAAARLPLVQIPAGSGNGLAASTGLWNPCTAVHALVKSSLRPCDVASVLQPGRPRLFSFLSLTYGMIPNLDIGTDHLRFIGSSRFVLGALYQILKQGTYEVHVSYIDVADANTAQSYDASSSEVQEGPPLRFIAADAARLQALSVSGASVLDDLEAPWRKLVSGPIQFFAACNIPWLDTNFHVAPLTQLNDGHLTLLYNVGKRGRVQSLRFMTAMDTGQHLDQLHSAKPIAFVLEPGRNTDTWVVVDGEEMPHTRAFVEVHPSLISVVVAPQ